MIKAVMLDWAGTMVDYGCFAPLNVFMEVFHRRDISITVDEARAPMGMLKRDHIKAICQMERVSQLWVDKFGSIPGEAEIDALYADFEPLLFETLHEYATPIPGAVALVERLRAQGIAIGSTTGYTREMMDIVTAEASKLGYAPDSLVTPSEVPAGRPAPWMIYQNAMQLNVYPMYHIVKAGDTVSDILEGVHAGCWSVGVLLGSSELGMTEEEVVNCDPQTLESRKAVVAERFRAAGAHMIIESIGQLDGAITEINQRLAGGERP
ncbi:phosphonoacetaldehyde hydrolase [Paenibacillus segetis]|nr:phosphonoacetaldehyde hydrolase [Paenibacillus segetis]